MDKVFLKTFLEKSYGARISPCKEPALPVAALDSCFSLGVSLFYPLRPGPLYRTGILKKHFSFASSPISSGLWPWFFLFSLSNRKILSSTGVSGGWCGLQFSLPCGISIASLDNSLTWPYPPRGPQHSQPEILRIKLSPGSGSGFSISPSWTICCWYLPFFSFI